MQRAAPLSAIVEQNGEIVQCAEMVRTPAQHVVVRVHRVVDPAERAENARALECFLDCIGIEDKLELELVELHLERQPRIMRGKISRRRRFLP